MPKAREGEQEKGTILPVVRGVGGLPRENFERFYLRF